MDQEFFRVPTARIAFARWPGHESVPRSEDMPASDTWSPRGDMSPEPWASFLDEPPDQEHTQPVREKRSSGRPNVLVVDEDEAIRALLEWGLERKGFIVWSAENGSRACQLYRDHCADIDVVLLEVSRLSWDGASAFFALQQINPAVRICLMSSDLGPYTKAELEQLGAGAFVRKPFQLDQVVRLLWALVDSPVRTSL